MDKFTKIDFEGVHFSHHLLAEFLGTATLLCIGCYGCYGPTVFHAATTFGVALTTAIQIFGNISGGHFNPAVTISACFLRILSVRNGLFYIAAQIMGALLGTAIAHGLTLNCSVLYICLTVPTVDEVTAFFVEFVATFFLVLLCCSVWDSKAAGKSDSVALKFGFFIFGVIVMFGPQTGASLNPARSFAPAAIHNKWTLQWIYWVAPILGGLLACIIYNIGFKR